MCVRVRVCLWVWVCWGNENTYRPKLRSSYTSKHNDTEREKERRKAATRKKRDEQKYKRRNINHPLTIRKFCLTVIRLSQFFFSLPAEISPSVTSSPDFARFLVHYDTFVSHFIK